MLLEKQAGFRKGRSCIVEVSSLMRIIRKEGEYNSENRVAFIDYER